LAHHAMPLQVALIFSFKRLRCFESCCQIRTFVWYNSTKIRDGFRPCVEDIPYLSTLANWHSTSTQACHLIAPCNRVTMPPPAKTCPSCSTKVSARFKCSNGD